MEPVNSTMGDGLKVLIIDGNPVTLTSVAKDLVRMGCQVFAACDGTTAVEVLTSEPMSIIFFDMVLPGPLDGPGVLSAYHGWLYSQRKLSSYRDGMCPNEESLFVAMSDEVEEEQAILKCGSHMHCFCTRPMTRLALKSILTAYRSAKNCASLEDTMVDMLMQSTKITQEENHSDDSIGFFESLKERVGRFFSALMSSAKPIHPR